MSKNSISGEKHSVIGIMLVAFIYVWYMLLMRIDPFEYLYPTYSMNLGQIMAKPLMKLYVNTLFAVPNI
jgi:hypothetical protein